MTVYRTDGRRVSTQLPEGMLEFETNVERVGLRTGEGLLHVGLPGGDTAIVELRAGRGSVEEVRAGRPAVYLDQNQWSKVAAWRHGGWGVAAEEAAAAEALTGLVQGKEIVLPASAGHFVETTPLYGEPRVRLASTVLALSRGWQMRNPLHVRLEELARVLSGVPPVADAVFAPSADVFFAPRRDPNSHRLPAPFGEISAEMTNVLGLYDALIDMEAIEDEGGAAEAAAKRWANAFAVLAARLHADRADRELSWRAVHANFLLDLRDELAGTGMSLNLAPEEVVERLCADDDPIGRMPFLARMRQLLFVRVRNFGQRWAPNDLIDSMFISCAAGYADVVIGERSMIGYLRQGRELPPGARLATTLAEGLELLGPSL